MSWFDTPITYGHLAIYALTAFAFGLGGLVLAIWGKHDRH